MIFLEDLCCTFFSCGVRFYPTIAGLLDVYVFFLFRKDGEVKKLSPKKKLVGRESFMD